MNVPDQVDERKDKIPMQTSQQSWLSISQKQKKVQSEYWLCIFDFQDKPGIMSMLPPSLLFPHECQDIIFCLTNVNC